jgi:hypothetical protein
MYPRLTQPTDESDVAILARIDHSLGTLLHLPPAAPAPKLQGLETCQDVAGAFLSRFGGGAVLGGFVNEVKELVEHRLGGEYWARRSPAEIINFANELYTEHEEGGAMCPASKELFKELVFNYF